MNGLKIRLEITSIGKGFLNALKFHTLERATEENQLNKRLAQNYFFYLEWSFKCVEATTLAGHAVQRIGKTF